MAEEIRITKKVPYQDDVISVRMKNGMLEKLEDLAARTNRSRNELINLLLESAINIVTIEE